MLMDFDTLVTAYDMKIRGVIHCGAHLGEEAEEYDQHGIKRVWWIEGNPGVLPKLLEHVGPYGHRVFNALLRERDGILTTLHVTNYDGMSSSILEFGTHPEFSPDTVFVEDVELPSCTIDTLVRDVRSQDAEIMQANLLVMDLQGAEGRCLAGAIETLPRIDYILTEVNKAEVYKGAVMVWELDDFLARWQFKRVETLWVAPQSTGEQGWGDALYVKEEA
jgi:FkbM family methyltransferase